MGCCTNPLRRTVSLLRSTFATLLAFVMLASILNPAFAADKDRPKPTLPDGTKLDDHALARHIDQAIDARLRAEKITPSPNAEDAEFLRRVYLDITGRIPTAEQSAAFLGNHDANKRAKLIDELLAGGDYGKHLADIWQALLLPRTSDNRVIPFDKMTAWLEKSFNANKPWNEMVRSILTASGDREQNGAVVYFLANASPDKLTDNATRMFLGVQLQCAQCHNHPFTDWKQDEYWGMAAFFTKVRIEGNPRQAVQQGGTLSVNEGGRGRLIRLPESAKRLPPKFLQGEQASIAAGDGYRPVLADWLTSGKNAYFSRAMVNRVWSQFFGRGLVHPVDDMHDGNAPSHPELLADLSVQFAANDFDVKYLIRAVCNSQAYQRTSKPTTGSRDAGPELFSRMAIKVLTPEQLFDSLIQVTGTPPRINPLRRPGMAAAAARFRNLTPRSAFVTFFKGDENAEPTEYQAGIPQVLRLMNAPMVNNTAMLEPLLKAHKRPVEIIEHLYLATLARQPTASEWERTLALVRAHSDAPKQAYGDILWALLNSSEFALNH